MHPYSTNEGRTHTYLAIAAVAFAGAYGIDHLVHLTSWSPPFWFEIPSIGTLYGALWGAIEKWAWRVSAFRIIGLAKTPDLSGVWNATLRSSHDKFSTERAARLTIRQTWTRMSIAMQTDESRSQSLAAALVVGESRTADLIYVFANQPSADAVDTMHAHRGTTELRFDGKTLVGEYYTGRDRANIGRIVLSRA